MGLVDRIAPPVLPSNGGSAYIDSDHLEINTPEQSSAADHPAIHLRRSARWPGRGRLIVELTARPDQNVGGALRRPRLVGASPQRLGGAGIFRRPLPAKPHCLGALATHLATATIFTGGGKVGAANGREICDFQLSQRADWFEELAGGQTMYSRPLVNCRDESHATADIARLHIIYFDNSLSPIARYLMAGTTQLVFAMGKACGSIQPPARRPYRRRPRNEPRPNSSPQPSDGAARAEMTAARSSGSG